MKNNIKFKINFSTNFRPYYDFKYDFNNTKKKKKVCKTFIFFLVLLKFFKKIKTLNNNKIFFKKTKNKNFTILRPPYRHKLSRHQIVLQRFLVSYIFYIKLKNNLNYKHNLNLINLINFFKSHIIWFESNILYQNNFNISLYFFKKNNFLINFFKIV